MTRDPDDIVPLRPCTDGLQEARRSLLERGEISVDLLHAPIARSWQRCLTSGHRPNDPPRDDPHVTDGELKRAAARREELLLHAGPAMEHVHRQINDASSMIILSDDRGLLLRTIGGSQFRSQAQKVALTPGASWLEEDRGTNAIGTALAESSPLVVNGAEHFLERNTGLTCAAAPVHDPSGRLLGILDISGDVGGHHPHTFGLVRTVANLVESRIFHLRHAGDVRLRLHTGPEGLGTVGEGLLALDADGAVLGANRIALAILGFDYETLVGKSLSHLLDLRLDDILRSGARRPDQVLPVRGRDGGRVFMRVESAAKRFRPRPVSTSSEEALERLDTGDTQLRQAILRASRVRNRSVPLLLQGETGVGKEVFARAVHDSSPRSGRAFVAVDCSALPEGLIESELFGYAPGAFTGARKEGYPGRIREAHGGTLFLDEIGEMPILLQSRLLRVLQDRKVTPLGGGSTVETDFELTCATHRNLKAEVAAGRFRADLYYRVNGLTLNLPSLKERTDLAALIDSILEDLAPGEGIFLDEQITNAFSRYDWPGNLRQLSNVLTTACALLGPSERKITWQHLGDDLVEDLPLRSSGTIDSVDPADDLQTMSETAIRRVLAACDGNKAEAARRLGISRNTLYRKLRRISRVAL